MVISCKAVHSFNFFLEFTTRILKVSRTMVKVVKIVQPSAEELGREVQTKVPCSMEGCVKVFPHSAALKMHLVKVHKIIQVS